MKIIEALIEETILPRKDKDWKFALAASPATQGWTVGIRAEDGTVGYGYAATMNHYGAPHAAVKGALDGLCKPLIGRDSREIAGILDDLDRVMLGNNLAKCGIDCALHDLMARRLGVPVCDLFGGPAVREFPSLRILPIKSPADMGKYVIGVARGSVQDSDVTKNAPAGTTIRRFDGDAPETFVDRYATRAVGNQSCWRWRDCRLICDCGYPRLPGNSLQRTARPLHKIAT
jgi:ABC-type amino acid transport substrate-binding protein